MKQMFFKFLGFLFVLNHVFIGSLFLISCAPQPRYVVEEIEDGDTLIVKIEGRLQRVQLSGIDAPENTENAKFNLDVKREGFDKQVLLGLGNASMEYLKQEIKKGDVVELLADLKQKDKYGRIPAIVLAGQGGSLNLKMVQEGYAVVFKRFPLDSKFKTDLEKAEKQAILNKKGLWKTDAKLMRQWSGR